MSILSLTHGYFSGAIIQGIFFAILTKTGIDVSPAGIGLTILKFLEPHVTEVNRIYYNYFELFLYALPFLGFVAVIFYHGKIGLVVYIGIIIGVYLLAIEFWPI